MQQSSPASSVIDVRYVAELARLALDDAEVERYERELGALLEHVADLANLPTDDVPVTAQVIAAHNVSRADEVGPGLSREAFLAGAPATQVGLVRVPRIIAEAE